MEDKKKINWDVIDAIEEVLEKWGWYISNQQGFINMKTGKESYRLTIKKEKAK